MYKIGISTCSARLDENLFADSKRAGVQAMEISFGHMTPEPLDYAEIKRLADQYGIELWSYHLPYGPFSILDMSRPDLCDFTIEYYKGLIEQGVAIGIKHYIVHPSGEPVPDADRAARFACAKKSFARLAAIAASLGAVICVEDLPRSCLGHTTDELLEFLAIDDSLRCCFDTGHLLLGDRPEDFVQRVGKKIVTLHLSEGDFWDDRHWFPGEGDIDWHALYAALQEVGYEGVWMYELGLSTPKTMLRERNLTRDDFVANAKEIFSGKPLTVYGKRKEGLVYWTERNKK